MEIQLWRSILCPYELAVRELEVKFNHIIDECKENDVYCPIEQVEGRVKSVSSILEKMQRKHIPMERMEEELEDIAGVRIICQFEEDIETVASLIQKRSDMVIMSEKNYLKHIKQSGYRSLHLIIYYTVETLNGPRKLQAEIQIRTMAMDFWATIEHSLQYKYKGDMPPHVAAGLARCRLWRNICMSISVMSCLSSIAAAVTARENILLLEQRNNGMCSNGQYIWLNETKRSFPFTCTDSPWVQHLC